MKTFLAKFASNRFAFGFLVVFVLLFVGCLGFTDEKNYNAQSVREVLLPPAWIDGGSSGHFLGTDGLGRDVASMILLGGKYSLLMSLIVAALSIIVGTLVGFLSVVYEGKATGKIIDFFTEVGIAFPIFFLCMVASQIAGSSTLALVFILSLVIMTGFVKVIRSEISMHYHQEYILVTILFGANRWQILLDILPNCVPVILNGYIVSFTMTILTISTLGFLGLGVQDVPEWGAMLSNSQDLLYRAWWVPTFIGGVIVISVVSVTFICFGLRDGFDYRR